MNRDECKEIESKFKECELTNMVSSSVADMLRNKLTRDGELLVDECSDLVHNTSLRMKIRTIRKLDGDAKAIGIGTDKIAVELI